MTPGSSEVTLPTHAAAVIIIWLRKRHSMISRAEFDHFGGNIDRHPPNLARNRPSLCRHRTSLGRFRPSLPNFVHEWASINQIRAHFDQVRPTLSGSRPKLGRLRPTSVVRIRPSSANFGQLWANSGPNSVESDKSTKYGQHWPDVGRIDRSRATFCRILGRVRPNLGHLWRRNDAYLGMLIERRECMINLCCTIAALDGVACVHAFDRMVPCLWVERTVVQFGRGSPRSPDKHRDWGVVAHDVHRAI